MSKSCADIKREEIYSAINKIVVGGATHITSTEKDNRLTFYFEYAKSNRFGDSRNQAHQMIESKIQKIKKYLEEDPDLQGPLNKNWIDGPHEEFRKFRLSIEMPRYVEVAIDAASKKQEISKELEDYYNEQQELANNLLREEAEEDYQKYLDYSSFDEEDLMSPTLFLDDSLFEEEKPIVKEDNLSFREYYDHLTNLLEEKKKEFLRYRRTAKKSQTKKENIRKYNDLINTLTSRIEKLDYQKSKLVFEDIKQELNYLEKSVENISAKDLEFQDIRHRLDSMLIFFLSETIDGTVLDKQNNEFTKIIDVDKNFYQEVCSKLIDIRGNFSRKRDNIILKYLAENPLTIENAEKRNLSPQEFINEVEKIKEIIDKEEDINTLQKLSLGIFSGGGVLGQLLGTFHESTIYQEQAYTAPKMEKLKDLCNKFKIDPSSFIHYFTSEKGVKVSTGRLIHPYSEEYFKNLKYIEKAKKLFNQSLFQNKTIPYEKYMKAIKSSQEVIDIRKLKVFKDKYINYPFSNKVFTFSEEEMNNYENYLKEYLGENMYNFLLEEQTGNLEDYFETLLGSPTEEDFVRRSPFFFSQHFYSEDYSKKVRDEKKDYSYYPTSTYNVFFPRKEVKDFSNSKLRSSNFYNKDFYNSFGENSEEGKEKFEAWKLFMDLLTNEVNPSLQSYNLNVDLLDLPTVEAFISKQIIEQNNIGFMKKSSYIVNQIWRTYRKSFYNSSYLKSYEEAKENKEVTHLPYQNSIKIGTEKQYKILCGYSLEKLQEIAEEEGLGYKDISEDLKNVSDNIKENLILRQKYNLARLIVNYRNYNRASSDVLSTLEALVDITNVLKAKNSSIVFANLIRSYISNRKSYLSSNNNLKKKDSKENLSSFFDLWIARNLYGDSIALDRRNKILYKTLSAGKKVKLFGFLSPQEKELKKLLKETYKDIDNIESVNFYLNDKKYIKEKDKFFTIGTEEEKTTISEEEFKDKYKEYKKEEIKKLGIPSTVGSVVQGLLHWHAFKALGINLKAGLSNRASGINQTNIAAASGRYGFTEETIDNARRILSFYNLDNLSRSAFKGLGFKNKKRYLTLKTTELIAKKYFNIFQNRGDQYAKAQDYSQKTIGDALIGWTDFAVKFPENHNQLEIVLGVLGNTVIYDNEGNQHYIIEGDDFSCYVPGTLELKKEFREGKKIIHNEDGTTTIEKMDNTRIWEDFEVQPGKRNTHIAVFTLISQAICRSQGNYNKKDIPAIFSSTWGQTLMLFKRWLPEQINNNLGEFDYDLVTGTEHFEGRKLALAKNFPLALTHLSFYGLLTSGIILSLPISAWIGLGVSGIVSVRLAVKMFKKQQYKSTLTFLQQSMNMIDYMQEVLLRSIDAPFRLLTRGRNRKIYNLVSLSRNISDKISPLKKSDRLVMSENAAELANLVNTITITITSQVLLQIALAAFSPGDDWDEKKKNAMKKYERVFNFINNRANMLLQEIGMNNNITIFKEEYSKMFLLNSLTQIYQYCNDILDYIRFDEEFPSLNRTLKLPIVPAPIPGQINDFLLKENQDFLGDAKVYENHWWNIMTKPDEYLDEKRYKNGREKMKNSCKKPVMKFLREKYPNLQEYELEERRNKIIKRMFSPGHEFGLKRNESHKEFMLRTNKFEEFDSKDIKHEIEKADKYFYRKNYKTKKEKREEKEEKE